MNYYQEERNARAEEIKRYKAMMIENILEWAGDRFTREDLERMTTSTLERIHDNC